VLSAIGATPGAIARMVWAEAVVLASLGWAAAVLVSLPASWLLESIVGSIFFRAPLAFEISVEATAAWLVVALALASIASLAPAGRAARLSVREAWTQT
jgi:putative ABC transport system permease protein